jgi:hypothetical protein
MQLPYHVPAVLARERRRLEEIRRQLFVFRYLFEFFFLLNLQKKQTSQSYSRTHWFLARNRHENQTYSMFQILFHVLSDREFLALFNLIKERILATE